MVHIDQPMAVSLPESHQRTFLSELDMEARPGAIAGFRSGPNGDLSTKEKSTPTPQALQQYRAFSLRLGFRSKVHDGTTATFLIQSTRRFPPFARCFYDSNDPSTKIVAPPFQPLDEQPLSRRRSRDKDHLSFMPPQAVSTCDYFLDTDFETVRRRHPSEFNAKTQRYKGAKKNGEGTT
jgi:hypothetical protein